jgi:hypothetical protein
MMVLRGRGLILIVMMLLSMQPCSAELKAKWTPANEDGAGPLPQSMKKRQQLLHLEKVIADSHDPAATLKKVAESMGMKPRDLGDMLERNAADMSGGVVKPRGKKRRFVRRKLALLLAAAIAAASVNHFL